MRLRAVALFVLALALLAVVAGIVVLLNRQDAADSAPLPTLAGLATLPPTAEAVVAAAASASPTPAPPTAAPSEAPASPTPAVTASETTGEAAAPPTQETLVTAAPAATIAPRATATEGPTPAPPTAPPALPTITFAPGVALNEQVDVGTGFMLVVSAERPGDDFMREIGGEVGPAPAGYSWLLVELVLLCNGDENCAPSPSALRVAGSTGRPYPPASGYQVEPLFGPDAFSLGQVWGYLAFTIPDAESGLTLIFDQDGQRYTFSLEEG